MNKKIRIANEKDYAAILKIYEPYITNTLITYECKIPSLEDFSKRLFNIQKTFPLIVCEIDDCVVGYAYISRFREREAYDWAVESSIYIDYQYHGKNIGTSLYFALIELSKLLGYNNMIGVVTVPNLKSEKLHAFFKFSDIGILHNIGYKNGSWSDVKYSELKLNDYVEFPVKPKNFNEISLNEVSNIIEKAENLIKG